MALLLWLSLLLITGVEYCHSSSECGPNSEACESLFRAFENALLANGSNLYNLRRLFYPPSSQSPDLANITYYVKFSSTASGGTTDLPYKECDESDASYLDTGVRYGWTTIGIYTFIHPALLNQLQVQLPFAIMKITMKNNAFIEPFLWDGYSNLPSADIHLNILSDNFTCPPPLSQVDEVFKTLTSLVRNHFQRIVMHFSLLYTAQILCTV